MILSLLLVIHPIQFSLSETKFVDAIPPKTQDFAYIIPGDLQTYVYTDEEEYRKDYQRSYFAVTKKKGGWDCLRHYEIIANGCIPYFLDLEHSHPNTMRFLPKELILEAMQLDGVSYLNIDHSRFDEAKYFELLEKIMAHARKYLTSKNMAAYLLETMHYSGKGKVLYLSNDVGPDYLRCTTLIGLKELLGDRVVDVPKIDHIYQGYEGDLKQLAGKGFSYTRIIEDLPLDRDNIEARILAKEFELVIYGSVHRGIRHRYPVLRCFSTDKIAYLCGEDDHRCKYTYFHNLFLREFESL